MQALATVDQYDRPLGEDERAAHWIAHHHYAVIGSARFVASARRAFDDAVEHPPESAGDEDGEDDDENQPQNTPGLSRPDGARRCAPCTLSAERLDAAVDCRDAIVSTSCQAFTRRRDSCFRRPGR